MVELEANFKITTTLLNEPKNGWEPPNPKCPSWSANLLEPNHSESKWLKKVSIRKDALFV